VTNVLTQFAASSSGSGLGAFNINLKSFIFQLITFILVLLVFKRWILPPILKTLDARRKTLEDSLTDAQQTKDALAKAELRVEELLGKARTQADEVLAEAKKTGAAAIANSESAAAGRAATIIKDAEAQLGQERDKLREELRRELAVLVADATEKIINEKLDPKKDLSLIERAIRGVSG
jgi:F-type H+-transporting ATPase subunit b